MTTILLVDDSATILMSMSAILKKSGFDVVTAGDGQDALVKVGSARPNLIISDLNMPRMDGLTFIKEVRKAPGQRFTPILMLTTESEPAKRQEAKAAGATGWLVKPVTPEALLTVIRQVLPGT
ncbi:MAG TPA: response regulator [Kineosporiaceae bacterium]|nr:response regulator [Kineosporiaceae bacterium]